ncbi:MAG TPA: hypothetical protein EYQ60_15530 [Myxococcales bacterium]|nr:hypothetical protein [Myxococcales bacterium]HIK85824.1 hypothetical protein [Myxococcales bacterium]
MGHVLVPAGLVGLLSDDAEHAVDSKGMFRAEVAITSTAMEIVLAAVVSAVLSPASESESA